MHSLALFWPVFFRQLRFWSLHGTLHALPSLLIALGFLKPARDPMLILLILLIIGFFIGICAVATSLPGPLADERHVLSRSLKKAVQLRSWLAMFSLGLLAGAPATLLLVPDVWCGFIAAGLVHLLSGGRDHLESGDWQTVLSVVMVEGVVLVFLILLIGFCVLIVYQSRDRRNAFAAIAPSAAGHR